MGVKDHINDGLPNKNDHIKVSKKMLFLSMEKIVGSALELSAKGIFSLDKKPTKIYGLKTLCSDIHHI